MTDQDAVLGKLVREYEENCRTIAAMRTKADSVGEWLSRLGSQIKSNPGSVSYDRGDFQFPAGAQVAVVPESIVDAEALKNLISELHSCLAKQRDMEDRLRQAGMEGVIKSRAASRG